MKQPLDILILEDDDDDRFLLERALRKDGIAFKSRWVYTRRDFERALQQARPDVILADGHLPDIDARDALELVARLQPCAPVVVVTGGLSDEDAAGLLRCGAQDYVLKDRLARLGSAVLAAIERTGALQRRCDDEALLKAAFMGTIEAITRTCEKRDPYTAGHQARVAELAVQIAREIGMPGDRIEGLRLGALVHDIGKIYVPAEILSRPGRLKLAELELVKDHAEAGYDILKDVAFPWPVAQMVLQHHERLDGSGYPFGISGEAISPEARVIAVADVVESMTSHRPYRPALGLDLAMHEIASHRATRYDAAVVDACLRIAPGCAMLRGHPLKVA